MEPKLFMELVTLLISAVAIVLSIGSFIWNRRISILNADNDAVTYVLSVLKLFEKVKNLDAKEKAIFKQLLKDAEYFKPTNKADKKWPSNRSLEEYFKSI